MKTKLFTLLFALLSATSLFAEGTKIGILYYNLDKNTRTAKVTYESPYWGDNYAYLSGAVVIPSSVTYNNIQYSVTSIGSDAFVDCTGLTSVTIPNSVTSIGDWAFYDCTGLTKTNYTGDIASWCKIEFNDDYSNPICYSHNLYINDVEVQDLVIPNSVTSIGSDAFYGCTGLTSVTIPNSVTSIGDWAFYDCTGLTKTNYTGDIASWCKIEFNDDYSNPICYSHNLYINDVEVQDLVIPNSVTSIGSDAFYGCTGLTSVTIPNSVTSIGDYAFYNCTGLTSVTIPNSVTSIGSDAFYGCTGLTSVTIPNSVTTIGIGAFGSCTGLTSVTIGNSVTTIGDGAFYDCTGLTSVTIPNSVTTIGIGAFESCTGLTSVTIPNSVTTIGIGAFESCTGLTSVTWNAKQCDVFSYSDDAYSYFDAPFYNCHEITAFTFGNEVESIPSYLCCNNMDKLTSVTIGNSVTSIGDSAFYGCTGLRTLSLGSGITTIDSYAFSGCTALLTMEVKATLPPMIQSNTFNDVSTTVMLTVPCESQNYYKAAQYWNQFTNWQEALSFSAVTEDAAKGKVSVTQKPTCDDPTAVIKAVPAGGYRFKEWSDGNTENPRTVWVDEEMDLVAYFAAEGDGVENIVVIEGVSMAGNRLCIAGHEEENMNLYSATGAQLYAGQVRDITLPNAGVYLVQIGTAVQKLIVP